MDTTRIFKKEKKWEVKLRINKTYCTIFLKKNNRPIKTVPVEIIDEKIVKLIFIREWILKTLEEHIFENINDFIFDEKDKVKLLPESEELIKKFDKKYRLLISNK